MAESKAGADRFLDLLLAHGTTSAVVFATVHKASADSLFAAAEERGMRLITGKVLMDRHAPDGLRDDVEQAERDCVELIERWHGRGRLAYAVTVRFAPTSSAGAAGHGRAAVPRARGPLHADACGREPRRGGLGARAVPRGAQLSRRVRPRRPAARAQRARARHLARRRRPCAPIRDAGAQIAHCPSSNLFLGSGLFDWHAAEAAGVNVSLASDVGGGTTLSMNRIMGEAYKVQALAGRRLTAWKALHAATLGAAEALGLAGEIGSFEPGRTADVCAWDWAGGALAERRMAMALETARRRGSLHDTASLHERVFAWMTLADDRNLAAAYVAGVRAPRPRGRLTPAAASPSTCPLPLCAEERKETPP